MSKLTAAIKPVLDDTADYYKDCLADKDAEISRLRTNLSELISYLSGESAKCEVAGTEGRFLASYFRGKSVAFGHAANMAKIAYGKAAKVDDGEDEQGPRLVGGSSDM
ncbi:hypothetical protein ACX93W_01615 [Paenibacillus sp. CAU 1782]